MSKYKVVGFLIIALILGAIYVLTESATNPSPTYPTGGYGGSPDDSQLKSIKIQ